MADIVLPATTTLERDDIGYGSREPLPGRHEARRAQPVGEARDDYAIFAELAERLGARRRVTPKAATPWQWLQHLYELSRAKSAEAGVAHARRSTTSGRPASPRPRARTARR